MSLVTMVGLMILFATDSFGNGYMLICTVIFLCIYFLFFLSDCVVGICFYNSDDKAAGHS